MSKKIDRLENSEQMYIESGGSNKTEINCWDELERLARRNAKREAAKRWGRAMRVPATVFLCTCIIALCIIVVSSRQTSPEPQIDITADVDDDTNATDVGYIDESKDIMSETDARSEEISEQTSEGSERETEAATTSPGDIYDFDYSAVPDGSNAIIPADLSLISFGENYISNSTGYAPNIQALLNATLGDDGLEELAVTDSDSPTVLILHTHGTESYVEHGALYYTADGSELARSHNAKENVVAVGSVLADVLNKAGVPTLHSTVLHDSVQYKDAYARSAETVKKYLETYPSIKLVIDLHRDSIINSNGDIIKPITLVEGERCAQIKCTVGSSWSGEKYDTWEKNLSLALKLRRELNDGYANICRPVSLESTTYNQQLAPYSLLVEIGAIGNSLEEAMCAADKLGRVLAALVPDI